MNKQYRIELLIAVDSTGIPHAIKYSRNTACDGHFDFYTKLGNSEHTIRYNLDGETTAETGVELPKIADYDTQSYFTAIQTDVIRTVLEDAGIPNTALDRFISVAIDHFRDSSVEITCNETMRNVSISAVFNLPDTLAGIISDDPISLVRAIAEQGIMSFISYINGLCDQSAA